MKLAEAALALEREASMPSRTDLSWILLLATSASLFAACSGEESSPSGPPGSELRAAQQRWSSDASDDYQFVLQRVCECLPADTRPVLVVVRDGVIVSLTDLETGSALPAHRARFYYTVEGLFGLIDEAIDQGAAEIRVDYDPIFGYPLQIVIDYDAQTADDEIVYLASNLERLPS
jgi:hypothetical protein